MIPILTHIKMESLNSPEIIYKKIKDYPVLEFQHTNIYIIENILDEEICQDFIQLIETIPKITRDWSPGNNVRCFNHMICELFRGNDTDYYPIYTDETEIDNVLEKMKKNEKITTNRLNGIKIEQVKVIQEKLNNRLNLLDEIFKELFKKDIFSFKNHCGMDLRKIYGETREHQDGESPVLENEDILYYVKEHNHHNYREKTKDVEKKNKVNIRILTTIFALNDDYEGGELCFPNYNIKTKLKKGSMVCFPPFWTHIHSVESPLNDTFRYTLNTWIYKNEYSR